MNTMDAWFTVEGASGAPELISYEIGDVSVRLTTDGRFVWIESLPGGERPVLTPKGWYELATRAEGLLREANEAWARMEAAGELR